MVSVPVNTQNKPVEYLTRKFAINHNLPTFGKLVDPTHKFPTLSDHSAMALACVALLKLRVAEDGKAQAAGAEWDAELAAAKTFADATLAAVSASQAGSGYFPTPARIGAAMTRYALRKGNVDGKWSAPGNYDFDAFTHANTVPVAAPLVPVVNRLAATSIDLMAGVSDAEGDAVIVRTVNGKNWVEGNTVKIGGITFTMSAAFTLTKAAPTAAAASVIPFITVLSDGYDLRNRSVTLTIT